MHKGLRLLHVLIPPTLAVALSSCGLKTPNVTLSGDPHATSDLVIKIIGEVHRQLGCAVVDVISTDVQSARANGGKRRLPWLDSANAILTLTLTAQEISAFNPGATISQPFANSVTTFPGKAPVSTPQSFAFGIGGSVSSDATRQDVSDYTISIKDAYMRDRSGYGRDSPRCSKSYDGYLTDSDLHLYDWLDSRLRPYIVHDELKDVAPKTLTTTITFVVKASGSVNPTWKLVPTSFSTASTPLFSANRNDTDVILITIGASAADAKTAHDIAKTGAAVGIANASTQ